MTDWLVGVLTAPGTCFLAFRRTELAIPSPCFENETVRCLSD